MITTGAGSVVCACVCSVDGAQKKKTHQRIFFTAAPQLCGEPHDRCFVDGQRLHAGTHMRTLEAAPKRSALPHGGGLITTVMMAGRRAYQRPLLLLLAAVLLVVALSAAARSGGAARFASLVDRSRRRTSQTGPSSWRRLLHGLSNALRISATREESIGPAGKSTDPSGEDKKIRGQTAFKVDDVVELVGNRMLSPFVVTRVQPIFDESRALSRDDVDAERIGAHHVDIVNQDIMGYDLARASDGLVVRDVLQTAMRQYQPYPVGTAALCNVDVLDNGRERWKPCSIEEYTPSESTGILQHRYRVRGEGFEAKLQIARGATEESGYMMCSVGGDATQQSPTRSNAVLPSAFKGKRTANRRPSGSGFFGSITSASWLHEVDKFGER